MQSHYRTGPNTGYSFNDNETLFLWIIRLFVWVLVGAMRFAVWLIVTLCRIALVVWRWVSRQFAARHPPPSPRSPFG